ncbi:hypothetical protein QUA56_17790 [Microcoleus sp. N3A4]|uniref:hypothetical protein n=1 Tax=Microcoleus sp. N3A4 TaxID=3055379 RepID=UPI002FD3BB81
MLLQEVKEHVFKLPPSDRLALVGAIIESLQDRPVTGADRSGAIQRMRGLLKTDQPAPTDEDVAAMLEARRVEKYL